MKKKFLKFVRNIVIQNNPEMSDDKVNEVMYGIESIYLTVTKIIIINLVALLLGIFWESLLLTVLYNVIRVTAFGLHAEKSSQCLIISLLMFIVGVYVCQIEISFTVKVILSLVCLICIFIYAPADTYKRPLINPKKRKKFKIISFISASLFTAFIILYHDNVISNYLLIGLIEAVIVILPITYKLLKLPYANYKNYNYGLSN